ncbi:phosphodiesterase [Halothermothrix orenii]|uniref:Phosphoesterase n=1 Tax=Halothermothrix orenii (strain H 168 / OCM 544 / DSM 9562) TaxID=373903 RepID=B8CWB3_HALOH|nr:phosphodiesterase [Halothermothrix orenii]ACL69582.1 phosphodiesterase, MJ0936 family [Halothermothrix orenii H 168]
MKESIVVVSDTHGSLTAWKKAEGLMSRSKLVIHAGDVLYHGARNPLPDGYNTTGLIEEINKFKGSLMMVKGNVDSLVDEWVLPYPLPEYVLVEINGLRLVVYHGYQHNNEKDRIKFARRFKADILIYGHTHIPEIKNREDIILLNPGSMSLPKQKPAIPSVAVIKDNSIEIIDLDSLEIVKEMTLK